MNEPACALCAATGGALVFQAEKFRVIRAQEAGFPAFYRVVWTAHVAEFSSLDLNDRALCMAAVCAVEQVLREQLQPTKINLAALGNVVPHLHWHVIARFGWDSHFPAPVWGSPQRPVDGAAVVALAARLDEVDDAIARALSA
ncbi:MAG: HIT family protein [Gammaproteobacteria bacterium]|uniref:HIT family protein n=1 Tax=Rhodoferax sp. TaxID=50421 RepID=UPI001831EBEC|nr:HIT family protein [Rhodoferax sp.]MBU3897398.1 HIT family protein [Gammaproteobacteria bacterium]MBA3057142.1 HIT family protein [Rhodoferax sp.]MBU3999277.1 HIT family protein [Gammaproteobacteria bacterium]MBU4018744.1 HIT family protein [Gammaproteobacteria bacterium]MBU4079699.1 HIT family protein [Gammaproteobacteria bacterium]